MLATHLEQLPKKLGGYLEALLSTLSDDDQSLGQQEEVVGLALSHLDAALLNALLLRSPLCTFSMGKALGRMLSQLQDTVLPALSSSSRGYLNTERLQALLQEKMKHVQQVRRMKHGGRAHVASYSAHCRLRPHASTTCAGEFRLGYLVLQLPTGHVACSDEGCVWGWCLSLGMCMGPTSTMRDGCGSHVGHEGCLWVPYRS